MNASAEPAGFPQLFPRSWIGTAAARLLGFHQVRQAYDSLRQSGAAGSLTEQLLEFMEVTYSASPRDLEQIPRTGATVVVANHPFGILEAAVLVSVLQRIRPDVRVLANELLCGIPELRDVLLPVDVFKGSARLNAAGARKAVEFLRGGGMLLVFPAGSVSHFQWHKRAAADPPWNPDLCRLIAIATARAPGLSIVPVFVPGSNSFLFHAAGMMHSGLRTALLARELLNKRRTQVELRIGRPVPATKLLTIKTNKERIQYLRWRTDLLAHRETFKPTTARPLRSRARQEPVPTIAPAAPELLQCDVARLPAQALLKRSGELEAYLANATQLPNVLREIGRLREVTFRAAGEGTGKAIDLDPFDAHYLHLFVWDAARRQVVGAYRLQGTDQLADLYTRTLFRYDHRFLTAMGPALELGRSFVRTEYQKAFAPLLLLWKGIGTFVARNPQYRVLFGPVSISNQYQAVSRELMLAFLDKRARLSEWVDLVRAKNAPPRPRADVFCDDIDDLSEIVADLEPAQAGVPVLLRQYLRLGGRLLGFNVDPEFSNALDGLIVVDLTRTDRKLLERYLGKSESADFLNFHKEKRS